MASFSTANYQLCQWEPTDQVQRTDFNADNAKIDAALAGKLGRTEHLKTLNVTSPAYEFTVDLSDIVWEKWELLILIYDYNMSVASNADIYVKAYLNNHNLDSYCSGSTNHFVWTPAYPLTLVFLPWHNASRPIQALCFSGNSGLSVGEGTFSQLETIHFYRGDGTTQSLPSGTTIDIWGVS